MSIDHNRIKVADLENGEPNKILITNNIGELAFSDMYNALDCNVEGKALDARQGKELKVLIDDINTLLQSDDINLDTLQEIIDTIKTVETSLATILVNDLNTGGTSKALTAEQGKVLKTQINTISTLLTSNDVNLHTLQELVDAIKTVQISLNSILINDLTTGGATKALTAEMGKLLQTNKEDKTNKISSLASFENSTNLYANLLGMTSWIKNTLSTWVGTHSAEVVDADTIMVGKSGVLGTRTWTQIKVNFKTYFDTLYLDISSNQNVTGVKTFLGGTLGFRNIANTFTSFFSNSNTASRTYILQDRNGTLADLTDIASVNTNKMDKPLGGVNFLSKFLTVGTIGSSRIQDTGTYVGIGTVNVPTKDITLGNQTNREIGIEESLNTVDGRTLKLKGGRTIDFVPTAGYVVMPNSLSAYYVDIDVAPNGDVYAMGHDSKLYKKVAGIDAFNYIGISTGGSYSCSLNITRNNDIYICSRNYNIVKQTNSTGAFSVVDNQVKYWTDITSTPSNDIWACTNEGIYKQTNAIGAFVNQNFPVRNYRCIESDNSGKIYVGVYAGDIYEIVSGEMTALNQTYRTWSCIEVTKSNDVIAIADLNQNHYYRIGGAGNFIVSGSSLPASSYNLKIASNADNSLYCIVYTLSVYILNNSTKGTPNLNGGALQLAAGTGKGTGQSRIEFKTGQKLGSGTDMQAEILREYIDENGHHIFISMPVYSDNASAVADGLPIGCQYRTATGETRIVI